LRYRHDLTKEHVDVLVLHSTGWNPGSQSLPEGISGGCAVTLDETSVMLIGGQTDSRNFTATTLVYDSTADQWFTGSSLRIPRRYLGCGIIR